jgi:hypothetical protein
MRLGEATRATIYTKDAAHRLPSHMTLMGKVLRSFEHSKWAGNQIPSDSACKTSTVSAARQSRGFSMASI